MELDLAKIPRKHMLIAVTIVVVIIIGYFLFPTQSESLIQKENGISKISEIFSANGINLSKAGLLDTAQIDLINKSNILPIKVALLNLKSDSGKYLDSELISDTVDVYIAYLDYLSARSIAMSDPLAPDYETKEQLCANLPIYESINNNLKSLKDAAINADVKTSSFISEYGEERASEIFIIQNRFDIKIIALNANAFDNLYLEAEKECQA